MISQIVVYVGFIRKIQHKIKVYNYMAEMVNICIKLIELVTQQLQATQKQKKVNAGKMSDSYMGLGKQRKS